ncbi:TPA: polysaccharide pyruvyl transferase family protein [Streptococcus suis]
MMEVFVRGFFHVNLGDDLFLYILARRYPKHNFHVIVNEEYPKVFESEKNIVVHSYKKIRRGLDRLLTNFEKDLYVEIERKCQLNIVIGGSIFQEGKNDLAARKRLMEMPQLNPTYILGANFGPYETENYRMLVQEYLTKAEDVCFRDEWSKEKFPELSNVRFAPDIVLGIKKIIERDVKKKKRIFISVIDCFRKEEAIKACASTYESFLIRCIEYYSRQGYEIILSSFCKMEGDEEAISKIAAKLTPDYQERVKVLNYSGNNWEEMLEFIMESEKVIASRFHSMILGMVFNIPVLPIAYNSKFIQFLNNFDLSHYCVTVSELDKLAPEEINYILLDKSEEVARSANEHFKKLDKIL